MVTLLSATIVIMLVAVMLFGFRDQYVFRTNIECIDDFYDFKAVQQDVFFEQVQAAIDSGQDVDYTALPNANYTDHHYTYNEMLFNRFFVWNKKGFIKVPYK